MSTATFLSTIQHQIQTGSTCLEFADLAVTDDHIRALAQNLAPCEQISSVLFGLSQGYGGVTAQGLETLALLFPMTETLDLRRHPLGDESATMFSGSCLNKLRVLLLADCRISSGAASSLADLLRRHPGLSRLDVSANSLGDTGIRSISSALDAHPGLRDLRLADNDATAACIDTLAANAARAPLLELLDLRENDIDPLYASSFLAAVGSQAGVPLVVHLPGAAVSIHRRKEDLAAATPDPRAPSTDDPRAASAPDDTSRWLPTWREAVSDVANYAARKRDLLERHSSPWYMLLEPRRIFEKAKPFPALPPVYSVVPVTAEVSETLVAQEYGFTKADRTWHLSAGLLKGFSEASGEDPNRTRSLIRLFLFHEYLHDYHSLTKLRAGNVGRFANCLEYIDYTADSYAVLHQFDLQREIDRASVDSDALSCKFITSQVEQVLRSFWAFDPEPPILQWQVRRLRRYLNWYWRLTQLTYSSSLEESVTLLSRPPHVELAGLRQFVVGPRVFCRLDEADSEVQPELAIVLDNEKLLRVPTSTFTSVPRLLEALSVGDHREITRYFEAVFEIASDIG